MAKYEKLTDACYAWVNEFNQIPTAVMWKLLERDECDINEITPPTKYDKVYITGDEWEGEEGVILQTMYDGEKDLYVVRLNSTFEEVVISSMDFYVKMSSDAEDLPVWGFMWSFGDRIDDDWLKGDFGDNALQMMADIGFRIFEQEDIGYVFGLDAAGQDFYEAFWIPLYKARGLKWHDIDDTVKEEEKV